MTKWMMIGTGVLHIFNAAISYAFAMPPGFGSLLAALGMGLFVIAYAVEH